MQAAFIKNGIVENVADFAEKDETLAKAIVEEHGYDDFKFDENCGIGWTYDGKKFTPPAPTAEQIAAETAAAEEAAKRGAVLAALAAAAGLEVDEVKAALGA